MVEQNINKARHTFFATGPIGTFQGALSYISQICSRETCVFPVLLYGCELYEVRDITAMLLAEICHGVTTEPHIQSLLGKSLSYRFAITEFEDGAWLDVTLYGFWGEKIF